MLRPFDVAMKRFLAIEGAKKNIKVNTVETPEVVAGLAAAGTVEGVRIEQAAGQ